METRTYVLSDLIAERDALSRKILAERFAHTDKPLPYLVAILAGELSRGSLGVAVPRALRNKSFVWHLVKRLQAANGGRAPTFGEILAAID